MIPAADQQLLDLVPSAFMRVLAYLLILLGLLSLFDALYDEHRGIADAVSPGRSTQRYIVDRTDDPKQFRSLMAYQWFRGPLLLFGGLIILRLCRKADRLDPFAPDFVGLTTFDDSDNRKV